MKNSNNDKELKPIKTDYVRKEDQKKIKNRSFANSEETLSTDLVEIIPSTDDIFDSENEIDIDVSFSDETEDKKVVGKRTPKEKGIDYISTNEPGISKRYKDGIFQAYDVTVYFGRVPKVDKDTKKVVSSKDRIKRSFKTFEEAKRFRDEMKGQKADYKRAGKKMSSHFWTIEEVIIEYENRLRKDKRDDDYIADKERYGRHAKAYFTVENNNLNRVAYVERGNVEEYLLYLHKEKKYRRKTLEKERAYIHQLWEFMLAKPKLYGITTNVATGANLPAEVMVKNSNEPKEENEEKTKNSEYSARMLSSMEIEELIKEACKFDDPSFLFEVVFSITQGLRRGELCGLLWGDIDLENRTVIIQHNRVQTAKKTKDGKPKIKTPKGGRIRNIELHNVGYQTLMLYKRWQEDYLGMEVSKEDYVLRYEINLKYDYLPHTGKISRKWQETCTKINKQRIKEKKREIPYGRIHDGRHVYASHLLQGEKLEDGTIIYPASYIQVYESMGHSLPKLLRNTTTTVYNNDRGQRFDVTRFWNELLKVNVTEEWEEQRRKREKEWASLTKVQQDLLNERKKRRMEKAYAEKMNSNEPPEVVVEYTTDGELTGFEEGDL